MAGSAEGGDSAVWGDLGDGVLAGWAGLAAFAVDVEEVSWFAVDLLTDFGSGDFGGPGEGVADRLVEPDAAVFVEG